MDTLTDRITEAEACRVQFLKSLEEVRNKLTGPQLTVEAMSLLAKGLDVPEQVKAAAKQNPFFTSAILAFSAFILSGAFKTSVHKKRSSKTSKLTRKTKTNNGYNTTQKETHDENEF